MGGVILEKNTMRIMMHEIYTDHSTYTEMLNKWYKFGKIALVIELVGAFLYTFIAIRDMNIIIGIEAILFWVLFTWIKRGLDIINKKIEEK